MRIISGTLKGRSLIAPSGLPVRPTTDFARTGLFNLLNSRIYFEDISFLDLYCGTGAISLEMASRGCNDITSIDSNRNCIQFVSQTATKWGVKGIRTIKSDVMDYVKNCRVSFDLVFADPPYALREVEKLLEAIIEKNLVKPGGLFIIEHDQKQSFAENPHFLELRKYGNVNFSIFQF